MTDVGVMLIEGINLKAALEKILWENGNAGAAQYYHGFSAQA